MLTHHILYKVYNVLYMCAGLNNDCSVLFINMGGDDLFVFGNSVLIEWEEVGPVEDTECRLEQGDDIGEYFPCK